MPHSHAIDLNKNCLSWSLWQCSPYPRPWSNKSYFTVLEHPSPEDLCFAIITEQIIPWLFVLFHNFKGAAGTLRKKKKKSGSSCLGYEESIKVEVLFLHVSVMTEAFNCMTMFYFTNNTGYNMPLPCWLWCRRVTACNRFSFLHSLLFSLLLQYSTFSI